MKLHSIIGFMTLVTMGVLSADTATTWDWDKTLRVESNQIKIKPEDLRAPHAEFAFKSQAEQAGVDFITSCTATPSCQNKHVLSQKECPNQLPNKNPIGPDKVQSCYVCDIAEEIKTATTPPQKACIPDEFWFARWDGKSYRCVGKSQPAKFIQLCPSGFGAEEISDYSDTWDSYSFGSYSCRFAAASEAICNQCGSVALYGGLDGEVYCLLPAKLPTGPSNKPCK